MQSPGVADAAASQPQEQQAVLPGGWGAVLRSLQFRGPPQRGAVSGPPAEPLRTSTRWGHLKKRYLQQVSAQLSFSPEALQQWGPTVSYPQYKFDHLYNTDDIVSPPKKREARKLPKFKAALSSSVMGLPSLPALPPLPKSVKTPRRWTKGRLPSKAQAQAQAQSFTSPAPEVVTSQSGLPAALEEWDVQQRKTWLKPGELEARGWENIVLRELNKRTARWLLHKGPPRPGLPPSKWQSFLRHQYDWSHIRDELSSASDLELLAQLEAEEAAEFEGADGAKPAPEDKKPEMPLSDYFRIPYYVPIKKSSKMNGTNMTTKDIIIKRNLVPAPPVHRLQQINPQAGKYAYATDNAFEQEIYFDLVKIIHQIGMENDQILLESSNKYYKHLPRTFPEGPEEWNYEPRPLRALRPRKGFFRWTALPTPAKDLLQLNQDIIPAKIRRGRKDFLLQEDKNVPWELKILRNMLQEWKSAWILTTQWQDATVEGLLRNMTDIQDEIRIEAIITCATAAMERPRVEDTGEDSGFEKIFPVRPIQEIPEELRPVLKEALSDKNATVRMAAAVCHYTIQAHDSEAQKIMEDVLTMGNDADSWAAAQCLALDGIASLAVVKRLLCQLFCRKDKETEEQICLLLSHLSKKTNLIHTLLAVELNSCQWEDRIVACRALARINGSVSQDLKQKLIQLMWNDWNWSVRQAAARSLGQMNLGKEVHEKIRTMLDQGNSRERVAALSLIGWLKLMTSKLLPYFLNCFGDDFVAVRREACLAAAALKIKDKMVFDSLVKLVQGDPYWKIKAFAIRALGMIGLVNPQLIDLLLWAIHYEDEPGVRLEACRSILALQLQGDRIRDTFLDVLLLESHEDVLREVHNAMKILNLQDEGNQKMLQKIKKKISELSEKNLIINKILKIERIAETIRQETNYIYLHHPKKEKPLQLVDFFKDAFKDPDVPLPPAADPCEMEKALERCRGSLGETVQSRTSSVFSRSSIFDQKTPRRLSLNKHLKTIREKRIALGPFGKSTCFPQTE